MNFKQIDYNWRTHHRAEKIQIANELGYKYYSQAIHGLKNKGMTFIEIAKVFRVTDCAIQRSYRQMVPIPIRRGGRRITTNKNGDVYTGGQRFRCGIHGKDVVMLRCCRCHKLILRRHTYNDELFDLLQEHKGCIKEGARIMSKQLISTLVILAYNSSLFEQFRTQNEGNLSKEENDLLNKFEAHITKGFRIWNGTISKRDFLRVRNMENDLARQTFLGKPGDIVPHVSFGIALLEELLVFIKDAERSDYLKKLIEIELQIMQLYDKGNEFGHYEIADKAVQTFNDLKQKHLN